MNDANVMACAGMIGVWTSYANVKGDLQSSLNALPVKQVAMEAERLKRAEEARSATQRTGELRNADVGDMASSEDLRAAVFSLIANAGASSSDQTASAKAAAIMSALEEFQWCKLSKGTLVALGHFVKTQYVLLPDLTCDPRH